MPFQSAKRPIRMTVGVLAVISLLVALILIVYRPAADAPIDPNALERVGFDEPATSLGGERGDNAVARAEYTAQRLRNPLTGRIPDDIRARELAHARGLPHREQGAFKQEVAYVASWTSRGPFNVGGRTRALAIDLGFDGTTNRNLLAGGISGGMFRSEDDGASWRLTTSLADLASVTAIAQDPINRNVWYYGTGEALGNSASGAGASFLGHGIFKSTDGGASWAQLPATLSELNVFDSVFDRIWNLAVHPATGHVFAAVHGLILVSTDGGDTWLRALGPENPPYGFITDVTIAADGTVYATISSSGSGTAQFGVFRSLDNGVNWQNISPSDLPFDPWRMVVAPAPSDPSSVYLLVQSNQAGAVAGDHAFYRFNATAGTWSNLSANLPDVVVPDAQGNQPLEGNASFSTQGGYDMVVAVKPDDPDVVWIGGTNLYRSTDGGQSFSLVGGYATPYTYGSYDTHHADQHALAFYPNDPNRMLSGHDGGISRSSNALSEPKVWTSLNNGYLTSQFYAVAIDPEPGSDYIVGGLQDNGSWSTSTANAQTPWSRQFGGDGAFAAVAPGGLPFYVSSQLGNIVRASVSDNQLVGSIVTPAGAQDFLFIAPYVLDPNDARIMYLAAGNLVWRNSNLDAIPAGNGQPTPINWTPLTGSATPNTQVTALAVSTAPANRLYFGVTDNQFTTRLMRVDNPAANGAGADITPDGVTPGAYPSSIAVNPQDGNEVLVTFSNYGVPRVWYTSDGGASWVNVEGNLGGDDGPSASWGLIMPTASGTIYYLATSTGVYSTEALGGAGTAWVQEGAGLMGNVNVDMVIGRPEDGLVVAATHGRGVYSANLEGTSGSGILSSDVNRLELAAKPGETATGTFVLRNNGTVKLTYAISEGGPGKRPAQRRARLHTLREAGDAPVRRRAVAQKTAPGAGRSAEATPVATGNMYVLAGDDELIYDDGDQQPDDFWGFGEATALFWGNQFLLDGFDFQLERFLFYMRTEGALSNDVWVAVYDASGEAVVSGTVSLGTAPAGDWYEIFWNDPIAFEDGDTFFIEIGAAEGIAFPAGLDALADVPGRSFFASSGEQYVNLADQTGSGFEDGAFLVRAVGTLGGGTNEPPNVEAVVTTFNATVGQTITFDASASSDPDGTIVSYLWEFGDGATSDQPVVDHAYASAGTYTVVVTVTDDDGASAQASGEIVVTGVANTPPVAAIQRSPLDVAVGTIVTFDGTQSTDVDGQVVAYQWNFGDGVESPLPVTEHAYALAGTYNVSLTVTDNEGATGQRTTVVEVRDLGERLSATPNKGTLAPSGATTIEVSYNTDGLAEGVYEGQLVVATSSGGLTIPVSVRVSTTVGIDEPAALPVRARLAQNYPNPFNPSTVIQYELTQPATVSLHVYDVNGRRLRRLVSGMRGAGVHDVQWDATDDAGVPVASGIYLYRLSVGDGENRPMDVLTGKMALIR